MCHSCKQYLQHDVMEAQLQELQQQPGCAAEPSTQQQQQHPSSSGHHYQQQQQGQQHHQNLHTPDLPRSQTADYGLGSNTDVLACRADWLFQLGRYEDAYQLTSSILAHDPYATQALATHLTAALQLGRKNELFLR
eukprot:GHRR01031737.1.p1 GENE.GHRR01031737.1~~GHRR01031737.1.p1  ORF type:complete len:136 (-),score=65.15 GHRR01031737.1:366-773(-)